MKTVGSFQKKGHTNPTLSGGGCRCQLVLCPWLAFCTSGGFRTTHVGGCEFERGNKSQPKTPKFSDTFLGSEELVRKGLSVDQNNS